MIMTGIVKVPRIPQEKNKIKLKIKLKLKLKEELLAKGGEGRYCPEQY